MADHVLKAVYNRNMDDEHHHPTGWDTWFAGEMAAFFRDLIELGPDEEMNNDQFTDSTGEVFWISDVCPKYYLRHLARRLEAIAQEKG